MCDKDDIRSRGDYSSLEHSDPFCPDRSLPVSLHHAETGRIGALPVRLPMFRTGVGESGEQKDTSWHDQRLSPMDARWRSVLSTASRKVLSSRKIMRFDCARAKFF